LLPTWRIFPSRTAIAAAIGPRFEVNEASLTVTIFAL
jgi:hypothetical protein